MICGSGTRIGRGIDGRVGYARAVQDRGTLPTSHLDGYTYLPVPAYNVIQYRSPL